MRLRVSDAFTLPLDWMTMATVVYGARGSGKTTFGSVVAEEVTKAKQRFCAIDLKGDWYGLKSSADGRDEAIPVVIFGGDHADLPLEENAGAFVGATIASLEQSTVIDLEHLSKGKQVRFLSAFFSALYDKNREPLLLLLDEAQRYAPQRPMSPEGQVCLGAVEDLVKLGRKHGIGVLLATQRGSGLNKEVSEICDMLVAFRTPGPLDQDRVRDWLEANCTKKQRDEVLGLLAGLETGTAVFASGHPALKLFEVARVRERETFDSSATPKVGRRRKEPRRLAKPDLEQLRAQMAETIERAKADDPRALRQRIAELERSLATERAKPTAVPSKRVEVKVPVISEKLVARVEKAIEQLRLVSERTSTVAITVGSAVTAAKDLTRVAQRVVGGVRQPEAEQEFTPAMGRAVAFKGEKEPRRPAPIRDASLFADVTRMGKAFLTILAQHPRGLTKSQMLTYTGYAASGPVSKEFASLGRMGWVESLDRSTLRITDAGLEALGPFDPLPTGDRLRELRLAEAAPMERKFLELAFASYPNAVSKGDMLRQTGYAASGPVSKAFARLVRLGWLKAQGRGMLLAADEFFSA